MHRLARDDLRHTVKRYRYDHAHLHQWHDGRSPTSRLFWIFHRSPTPSRLSTLNRSRHDGGPYLRTPRAKDGRPVPAGLLACGSDAVSSLPDMSIAIDALRQWLVGAGSPLTVAGAAAASGALITLTAFPLDPGQNFHSAREPTRTHHAISRCAWCQYLACHSRNQTAQFATARTSVR